MSFIQRAVLITCIFSMVSLTACSSKIEPIHVELKQSENYSEFQNQAIEDQEVTREEYDQGFLNYQSCMEGIGFPLIDVQEINLQYDYSYQTEAKEQGGDECYFNEFSQIHLGWSIRPEVAELSPESKTIKSCLEKHSIEPAASHLERLAQFEASGIDIEACLTNEKE